jgi:site-specific recombinase XerD
MAPSIYGYSELTVNNYRSVLTQFKTWYPKSIEQAQPIDVMDYLAYLKNEGKSGGTLTVTTSGLRAFYDFLILQKTVTANPTAGIRQKGRKKVRIPVALDRHEVNDLLVAPITHYDPEVRERDQMLMSFMLSTGLRISEALQVKPNDIDFSNACLNVIGKNNKQATVFITNLIDNDFPALLDSYINKHNLHPMLPIFDMPLRTAQRQITKWGRKSGIQKRVTAHTLRHTFGTLLVREKGLGIEALKEAMRHENIRTTQAYIHSTPADLHLSLSKAGAI